MDKNGQNRGGARPGAGRKKKPLAEKIQEGKKAMVMDSPELDGIEMPDVKDYLKAEQRNGELHAEEIYKETWEWLKERGCVQLVSNQLLEEFALNAARWRQMEEFVSEYGPLGKHPTTGQAITSPFVTMSHAYLKSTSYLWQRIFQIVKENSLTPYEGGLYDDMERLLRGEL